MCVTGLLVYRQISSEEMRKEVENYVKHYIEPFMKGLTTNYKIWSEKYGADKATETVTRLFAYMIHGPLAGLKEDDAAGLINDISGKAFHMFMSVRDAEQKRETANNNAIKH